MLAEILLPDPINLELTEVTIEGNTIVVTVEALQPIATCPDCHFASQRVHSRYQRTVSDLPCVGRNTVLHLVVRRFFCDNEICKRKTFVEQFPDILDPFARRTKRLIATQHQVGLTLGGEAGARVLETIVMPTSSDTVLRLVRDGSSQEAAPTPRVLGVDDWAWCKGQKYGTILVDLERRRVIDLLADRSADTLADWLLAHPGVEIVSRDRAPAYIDGINRGAPNAIQIADRWHLLKNLKEALERLLEKNQPCLYAAAAEPEESPVLEPAENSNSEGNEGDSPLTKAEQRKQATRERRLSRYQAVEALHQQGLKERAIARELGMSRRTVRRYIYAEAFPEMSQHRRRPSILDPYEPHLKKRWAEGCHNGEQLYKEIQELGYTGSRSLLGRRVAQMRKQDPASPRAGKPPQKSKPKTCRPWSARYAVWLLMRDPEELSDDRKAALERMLAVSPEVRTAYCFGQVFLRIVRQRLSKALNPWMTAVTEYDILELSDFARSLDRDKEAVLAALELSWSNGQVEGQVNRLKLIKRQMYGRAKFDLLRARVLVSA
jgi:transposase